MAVQARKRHSIVWSIMCGAETLHLSTAGLTVEMHGNINQLVCPTCGVVVMMTPALLRKLKSKKAIPCTKCDCEALRCRIMLYDDGEGRSNCSQLDAVVITIICRCCS